MIAQKTNCFYAFPMIGHCSKKADVQLNDKCLSGFSLFKCVTVVSIVKLNRVANALTVVHKSDRQLYCTRLKMFRFQVLNHTLNHSSAGSN